MGFVIYRNSILASVCSMFGSACIVLAVMSVIDGELELFSAIGLIAAGLGLMWLGSVISERKEKKKRAKAASAQPQSARKTPCPHCHVMNPVDSVFCERCGQKMHVPKAAPQATAKPTQISCPNCRQINSPDSSFCLNCGTKLVRK